MAKFLINYKKMIALATARKSPIGVNPFLLQLGKIFYFYGGVGIILGAPMLKFY